MSLDLLANRTHRYKGVSADRVFRALTVHRAKWMHLHPGEVLPEVLDAAPNTRVTWSSFWPRSPDDTIELLLTPDGGDTLLHFRWRSDDPPDERGINITLQRLNKKLGGDIRGWFAA